jgi:hypothetical protein
MNMVPVNLYVDRMSDSKPVNVATLSENIKEHKNVYVNGANQMGLSAALQNELFQKLNDGDVDYVTIPSHLDAMVGLHHRTGKTYVLNNVVLPKDPHHSNLSMVNGWSVILSNGDTVYIPQECSNLSLLHGKRTIAAKPAFHNVVYTYPHTVATPAPISTPVPVIMQEPSSTPAPYIPAPSVPSSPNYTGYAAAGGVVGIITTIVHNSTGGNGSTAPSWTPPLCRLGSNEWGVCTK